MSGNHPTAHAAAARIGHPHHYRPTALDRALAGTRIIAALGPVRGITAGRVRAALTRLVYSTEDTRLALDPAATTNRWVYRPQRVADAVREISPVCAVDLPELLTRMRRHPGERLPLEVTLAGNYIIVDLAHALGDGRLVVLLLAALAHGPDTAGLDVFMARNLPTRALSTALVSYFGSTPARWGEVRRLHAHHCTTPAPAPAPVVDWGDWESSRRVVADRMPPAVADALRAWHTRHAPSASRGALSIMLYSAALRINGIECDKRVLTLVDCRRYLPPERRSGHGNFAVGVPLRFGDRPTLEAVTAILGEVTDSGWPLLAMGVGAAKAAVHGFIPCWIRSTPETETAAGGVRLAVSDLGRPSVFGGIDWAGVRGDRLAVPYVDAAGPSAMTVCVVEVDGARNVSASFHDRVIDRERVRAALELASRDPIAVLTADEE
jgi:hypothetical protein